MTFAQPGTAPTNADTNPKIKKRFAPKMGRTLTRPFAPFDGDEK
jgi:hypothetical protein